MSFKALTELALRTTQSFFGESVTYKSGLTETSLKAIFRTESIDINDVSTEALTVQIKSSDLSQAPKKNDQIIRGSKTYAVSVSQVNSDNTIYTLILKD